jgi:hypothetical protein
MDQLNHEYYEDAICQGCRYSARILIEPQERATRYDTRSPARSRAVRAVIPDNADAYD